MNRLPCIFIATVCLLPLSTAAGEPAAHVHGVASLQVAVDGKNLTLNLESPLNNLVGFEHTPRTEKQQAAVRAMAERLNQPAGLFIASPAAACTPLSVKLESPVLEPMKPSAGDGHADLDGEFVFRCEHPEALRALEVGLFQAFPRLKRLDVQVAGPRGQSAARLSPQQRNIAW
ncbi:MAG: DUF2796 domain-containing protein [Accumulibacter sp.]|jgi:hypothetical protein|uniref:DUF2796 domain-containing protein n=1 Tax=Accumulibacter sp. TaxID=2053492 RepID=UPI002FC359FD